MNKINRFLATNIRELLAIIFFFTFIFIILLVLDEELNVIQNLIISVISTVFFVLVNWLLRGTKDDK